MQRQRARGSKRSDLDRYAYRPDVVIESVGEYGRSPERLDELLPTMNRADDSTHDIDQWRQAN